MKFIKLTKGKKVKVDDDDFLILSKHKWYFDRYAKRDTKIDGKKVQIRMHRQILDIKKGFFTDHINGDVLDNRKSNLRICNKVQNGANRVRYRNNKSGFKGVYWDKERNLFAANLRFQGKTIHLGRFKNNKDAAIAYNREAKISFGEFALLNKV